MSVTNQEHSLLEHIGESYVTTHQLSEALGRSYGSVYASLVSLEKKGYVRGVASELATKYTQTGAGADALKRSRLRPASQRTSNAST